MSEEEERFARDVDTMLVALECPVTYVCPDRDRVVSKGEAKMWLLRSLRQYAKLRVTLEPFEQIDSEGVDDLPDDTKVIVKVGERATHYALTLGHYRRAIRALKEPRE